MSALGQTTDLIQLRVFFDYKRSGWSEVYYFNTTDYNTALTPATSIMESRGTLLPLNASIVRGALSRMAVKGDTVYVGLTAPMRSGILVDTEMTRETCNDPEVAVVYRYQDGQGNHRNLSINCLRDSWIADWDKTVVAAYPTPWTGPYTTIADGMASTAALGDFLAKVGANCVFIKKELTTPVNYSMYDFNEIVFNKVGKQRVGRSVLTPRARRS